MATSPTAAASTEPSATLPIHRLDVETYNQIVASGALEDQRVELLDGLIIEMSPPTLQHSNAIMLLTRHLADARAWLRVQLPIEVPPDAVIEPDLALTAARQAGDRHPQAALLVIEVAVSSHAIDRGAKASLYARAGIPVYWLIDVPGRAIEIRTNPGPDGYRHCEIHRERDGALPCAIDGGADLDLEALFGDI